MVIESDNTFFDIIILIELTSSTRLGSALFCNSTSTILSCPHSHALWREVKPSYKK